MGAIDDNETRYAALSVAFLLSCAIGVLSAGAAWWDGGNPFLGAIEGFAWTFVAFYLFVLVSTR